MRLSDCGTVRPKERGRLHRRGVTMIAVLLLVSIVCIIPAAAADTWDGTVAAGFAGGTGTETDPYLIATGAQLAYLAATTTPEGTVNTYFKLTDSIDLNNIEWTPIGKSSSAFKSKFDGSNKAITNLNISTPAENNVGLFGYIDYGAHVKNLNIGVTSITGKDNVGAAVGNAPNHHILIQNVHVTGGTVTGETYVGGVVGVIRGGSEIDTCSSDATVSGKTCIGGVVGYAGPMTESSPKIMSCFASGDVTGISSSLGGGAAGGVAGSLNGDTSSYPAKIFDCSASGRIEGNGFSGGVVGKATAATIANCSASGDVVCSLRTSSTGAAGGVIGYAGSSPVQNCSASGSVTMTGIVCDETEWNCAGGVVGYAHNGAVRNCYATGPVTCTGSVQVCTGGVVGYATFDVTNCAALNQQVTGEANVSRVLGFSTSASDPLNCYAWFGMTNGGKTFTSGGKNGTAAATEVWDNQTFYQSLGWDFADVWKMNAGNDNYQLPVLAWQATPVAGDASYLSSGPAPVSYFSGGDGSAGDPYRIASERDLTNLSTLVNAGETSYASADYLITAPLTLTGSWTPVGSETHPFSGVFNGDNQIISGLTINSALNYTGLFGYSTGTLKNVNLANVNVVSGWIGDMYSGGVGGLVGYAEGTIQNCQVSGTVSSTDGWNVGGLAGFINDTRVDMCGSTAAVSGNVSVGGLIGLATGDSTTVSSSYASGSVTSERRADKLGGLIGSTATGACAVTISNCYAVGDVTANVPETVGYHSAGGLVGYLYCGMTGSSSIVNSYAAGTVQLASGNTNLEIGGLVGENYGSITNSISLSEYLNGSTSGSTDLNRIIGYNDGGSLTSGYGWAGTKDVSGATFSSGGLNGTDAASSSVWNNQTFYETAGWDFIDVWKMNDGNGNYKLPVLAWQTTPVAGDASHLAGTRYTLTVTNGTGSGSYAAGIPVSVNATLPSGYAFTGWISDNGGTFANASAVNTTFTMPGNIVNITANMEALLVTSITITSPTEGTQYDISDAATAAARVYDQNGNEMSGILLDWSSSNPSILSVSGSAITANNAGNVVLTAVNGSVSANVNLTVLPAPVKPDLPEVDAEKNDDGSTTIDTTGKPGIEIKDADEEIIISDTNASVIVQYDDMTNVGGIVTGNISGITAVYQQMTAIPDIEAAGLANANVGLIIEITLKNVTTQLPAFLPAINLTDKEKIKENNNAVGIMLQARTPESFKTNVSSVTLTFDNVSKAWTDTYGGTQNIRVLHLADSGIISYLTGGTWAGPVNGAYTLKIDSPYGFSSYSLVGIPQTPVPPTPEVQDNGGTDDGAELLASVGAGPTSSAAPTVKPTGSVTVTPTAALTASPTGTAIPTTAVPTETATSRPSTTEAPVPLLGGLLGLAAGGLLLYQRR